MAPCLGAVLNNQRVVCRAANQFGQLGCGITHDVGDKESSETAGTVELL
jgi:hypothetical protein